MPALTEPDRPQDQRRAKSFEDGKLRQSARMIGEMAEWLKAHAWKACLGETLTWVRIPLSPPRLRSRAFP